jgi:hypothetical protein
MDFRRRYKAVFTTDDQDYPRLYYRNWWSPFWTYFGVSRGDDGMPYKRCLEHSKAVKKTVHFGRLPPEESAQ